MVLALSPHLDDAAFSAGATLAQLAARGERVVVATAFTASVPAPTGFALACQTDKGISPEVDYLALRRAEDLAACRELGDGVAAEHWPLPEAPHRGYGDAAALFAGVRDGDDAIVTELTARLRTRLAELDPHTVLYPVGAGGHVDHVQLIAAVDAVRAENPTVRWLQWYDQPYVARNRLAYAELPFAPRARGLAEVGPDATALAWPAPRDLAAGTDPLACKLRACAAYATQVPYQFYVSRGQEAPPSEQWPADIARVLGRKEWLCRVA